ncbi:unnamed protein product [Phytophthora fragariaefolia]|uniref:Unnamed protein product n=1 Tax=Phytophthora fragariaefolia TaxID=1490495 RepID=A0A9W6XVZ3_9STRA|nr:unnamed protein product [Phytophthora fragariaefolia]
MRYYLLVLLTALALLASGDNFAASASRQLRATVNVNTDDRGVASWLVWKKLQSLFKTKKPDDALIKARVEEYVIQSRRIDDALTSAQAKPAIKPDTHVTAVAQAKSDIKSHTDDVAQVPLLIKTNTPEDLLAMEKVKSWENRILM